jgi:hypothetical protein
MLTPAPGDTMADAIGKVAQGLDPSGEPLTFVRHLGDDDFYHRGPIPGGSVYLIPGLWTAMPADLLAALRTRRRASVTGRCSGCQAVLDLAAGEMRHEPDCPVCDDNLRPMLAAWLHRVGRYARGRRIVEDPT